MAVVNNFEQDDKDKNQDQNASQPISISGTSAPSEGSGTTPGSSAAPTVQGAPTSSGRFQNLQSYLDANKDYNAQGGGLAGQITGDYQKQATQYKNGIQGSQADWTNENQSKDINPDQAQQYVQGALVDPNAYLKGNWSGPVYRDGQQVDPNAFSSTQDPNRVYAQSASSPVNEQDQISGFQKYLNARDQYVAPTQWDQSQALASNVAGYQSQANLAQTEPGRYTMLQNLYGNPNYSSGQQKLDNLLLQANPDQLTRLNDVQGYAQDLSNNYQGAVDNTAALANQYANDAQATQDATRGYLGGAINDFDAQAQAAVEKDIADRAAANTVQTNNLANGRVTQADLTRYGINPNVSLYGIDPSKYLSLSTNAITKQNAITPDAQNYISALSKLAGNSLTGDPTQVLAAYNGNTAAGTADLTPNYFDKNSFNGAIDNRVGDYQHAVRDVASHINSDIAAKYPMLGLMDPTVTQQGNLNNPGTLNQVTNSDPFHLGIPQPNGTNYVPYQQSTVTANPNAHPYTGNTNDPIALMQYLKNLSTVNLTGSKQNGKEVQFDFNGYNNQLNNIMRAYGIDPNTGLTNSLQTIPDAAPPTAEEVFKPRFGGIKSALSS